MSVRWLAEINSRRLQPS